MKKIGLLFILLYTLPAAASSKKSKIYKNKFNLLRDTNLELGYAAMTEERRQQASENARSKNSKAPRVTTAAVTTSKSKFVVGSAEYAQSKNK